jgi:Fe-S oxidoreductase
MELFKKFLPKKSRWIIDILKNVDKEDRKNAIQGWKNRKRYYTNDAVDANLKDLARCANCPNMCRFDCPTVQISKKEPYAPAHKARISYFVGMDHLPWDSKTAIETIYQCTGCNACYQWCSMDISCGDLLFEMRAELEKRNLIPEHIMKIKTRVEENGSVFEHTPFHAELDFNHNDPNPEIFYYIGCMDLKYQPKAVQATMAILNYLKIPYCTHLESRECCGGPIRKAGFNQGAKTLSENNQKLLNATNVKTIISNCPGCVDALKNTYEGYGTKPKAEVKHIIEFIWEKIEAGIIVMHNSIPKTITYHDPCLLARRDNNIRLVDETRKILKLIPNLELKETYLHGDETRCCGMGGAYAISNPNYSDQLKKDRFQQLLAQNPDIIVSSCPTCEYAFQKANQQENYAFQKANQQEKIQDIVQLIAESLGVKYE